MLVFLDESGHPRPKDPCSRPVLAAVCIREADTGRLIRAMFGLRRDLLSGLKLRKAEEEGKATHFLSRRALTKTPAKREYVDSLFEYLRDFELTVFAIVMERPTRNIYEGPDFLQAQYRRLLDRIELFMESRHPEHMAVPIFDGQDPQTNRTFADCFTAFMVRTDAGRSKQHVVPTPLFVDSSLTPGIQIADWFAYVIRLEHEHQLARRNVADTYLSAIKRYANIIRQKTVDFEREVDFTWYGIASMGAERFYYERPEEPVDEASPV